jgi:prepilin-type processing-associated H-X9-DG protein
MYAADNDEALPNASSWMDETRSLVRSERSFRCPEAWREGAGAYGYAMNAKLSRVPVGQIDDAGATPLVFDSTLLMRNAGGGTDTVPKKGRHRGGNNVACADGHVEHVAGLFTSRPPRPL